MRYLYQIEGKLRNNIGDVLQGIVARAFLPNEAEVVDREDLKNVDTKEKAVLVANGWYMHDFESFPPPPNVNPVYISVHIADSGLLRKPEVREHFQKHSPIGCRDEKTRKLFLGWGIPAYFSGCLTTTINIGDEPVEKSDEILLVDGVDHPVPPAVCAKLEDHFGSSLIRISHDPPDATGTLDDYSDRAQIRMIELLKRYKAARKVVTTKIHCGLPSMGVGANVMVIHPNPTDPRLNTVREFMPVTSFEEILAGKIDNNITFDKSALSKRQQFLSEIVAASVAKGANIMASPETQEHKAIAAKARRDAKIYGFGIKSLMSLGLGTATMKKVYGKS